MSVSTPLQPSPFLERLIDFLLPYFISVCSGHSEARAEIIETLASYGACTRSELLNAAQAIAFGLSALDTLHEAKTVKMSPSLRLRYRGCANNLNRSGRQNDQSLAKRFACNGQATAKRSVEPVDDITDTQLREQIRLTHAKLAACGIHMPKPDFTTSVAPMPGHDQPWGSTMMQALSQISMQANPTAAP